MIKIKAGMERETLDKIEKFYKQYNNEQPFEYQFIDQDFNTLYAAENRVAILSKYFAAIAILISCLGLFGLTAFTARPWRGRHHLFAFEGFHEDRFNCDCIILSCELLRRTKLAQGVCLSYRSPMVIFCRPRCNCVDHCLVNHRHSNH